MLMATLRLGSQTELLAHRSMLVLVGSVHIPSTVVVLGSANLSLRDGQLPRQETVYLLGW